MLAAHHETRGHQMRHTKRQTGTKTLQDMERSIARRHLVTLTFLKEEKDAAGKKTGRLIEDVRSMELYDIRTTRAGHLILKGMDRATGEARTVRVDRLRAYTCHKMAFVLTRPEATTPPVRSSWCVAPHSSSPANSAGTTSPPAASTRPTQASPHKEPHDPPDRRSARAPRPVRQ
ncbi:hypothetical protein [Streptomyces microflavus]|uniref:hypothetical protein n=1 Tax=Streptomyces microflavus TaxID=1919 RepID=UPI003B224710